ncbi:MAG: alpha/beta hydrolase [Hyphomicrobiaceae bacterium]|nr:alpha/beta hydrolase [Hyphomicrobiaceae bacterium]
MPSLQVNGTEIHYAEAGVGGRPLLMVHGTLGDQRSFAAQMGPLAAAGFHVMALSMRHCWPGSWPSAGGDFRIDTHVADVAAFIAALRTGPVALLGHSRGGHIAVRVAERYPALLHALILAEPGGELDESLGGKPGAAGQASAFTAAADLVAAGDEEGGLKVVAEHTGGPGAWDRRPEERKAISRANARTMLGQRNEERRPYSRATATTIRIPTLFLYGANTRPNFVANVEALSGAIAGSKVVVIRNATHGLPYENPTDFNAAVVEFLQAH